MTSNKGQRQRQFPTTISTTAFVKLYILHLLKDKVYYGNKIKEEISDRLGNKWTPSPGMIYPLLRQLESDGNIEGWWEEPLKRSIRRYKITDRGIDHYNAMLHQYESSFYDSLFIIQTVLKDIYSQDI
ncbi:MAG TPA: PadR family transcriptional regulator [Tissierellaceae bacterium]|nr:PadR family transcriptional regulator [Tissierellaceae bacterium]